MSTTEEVNEELAWLGDKLRSKTVWDCSFVLSTIITGVMALFGSLYQHGTYSIDFVAWQVLSAFVLAWNGILVGREFKRALVTRQEGKSNKTRLGLLIASIISGLLLLTASINIYWVYFYTNSDYIHLLNHGVRRIGAFTLPERVYYETFNYIYLALFIQITGSVVIYTNKVKASPVSPDSETKPINSKTKSRGVDSSMEIETDDMNWDPTGASAKVNRHNHHTHQTRASTSTGRVKHHGQYAKARFNNYD